MVKRVSWPYGRSDRRRGLVGREEDTLDAPYPHSALPVRLHTRPPISRHDDPKLSEGDGKRECGVQVYERRQVQRLEFIVR